MKLLYTDITVAAPQTTVWHVLTRLDRYCEWNPYIVSASGKLMFGERVKMRLMISPDLTITVQPVVLKVDKGTEIRWLEWLLIPGLFDGEHVVAIHSIDSNAAHVVQYEVFTGTLVPLITRTTFLRKIRAGLVQMNSALKHRVERIAVELEDEL